MKKKKHVDVNVLEFIRKTSQKTTSRNLKLNKKEKAQSTHDKRVVNRFNVNESPFQF